MIAELRRHYCNVFYVTRPEHKHAKAGNLNYALRQSHSDLVITLDADFIPRPNIIQRLMPYFYVWNPNTGLYEFNETLAAVQSPQHFRNVSPHDSDPLDQRLLLFIDVAQPGKDWFNASTLVGTNNLISRAALEEAEYFPCYAITEDSAMSLKFHSLGYRTYYVNESLATGLATKSLRSHLRQRARWMKGDWQILLSKNGPLVVDGLTTAQRLLYFAMGFSRFMSFFFTFYDIAAILFLLGGIAPVDVQYPLVFMFHLATFLIFTALSEFLLTAGGTGLAKSSAATFVFEAIFRYTTMKGLFVCLFQGQNLVFKVTDKTGTTRNIAQANESQAGFMNEANSGSAESHDIYASVSIPSRSDDSDSNRSESKNFDEINSFGCKNMKAQEDKQLPQKELWSNLHRIWFNILTSIVLTFSIIWGIFRTPNVQTTIDGIPISGGNGDSLVVVLVIGFTAASVLSHLLAIYLCFGPYTSEWMLPDVVHGRCDQFAVHDRSGKLYVPWSYVTLVPVARMVLILGSIVFVLFRT
ncbi:CesA-like Cellulose synthase (UDP-forming) family GT2 [Gracilaria domingensis]|nr:CesA-like Cellulose synthase (UDP-forming) family GT2 [Gracilaria domingensis]